MEDRSIKNAKTSDEEAVIAILALAFINDPITRWVYGNPLEYLKNFPSLIKAYAHKAFLHESAYYIDGYIGAALWLPPEVYPEENKLITLAENTIAKTQQADLFVMIEELKQYYPPDLYWHLQFIGIDPRHSGQGYGSMLLKQMLSLCDQDQKYAYLESTKSENISLYEKYGFELQSKVQVGSSPPIFPMLRKPNLKNN